MWERMDCLGWRHFELIGSTRCLFHGRNDWTMHALRYRIAFESCLCDTTAVIPKEPACIQEEFATAREKGDETAV